MKDLKKYILHNNNKNHAYGALRLRQSSNTLSHLKKSQEKISHLESERHRLNVKDYNIGAVHSEASH